MNAENTSVPTKEEFARRRKLWLDALESGKYTQYRGALTKINDGVMSHCCLGVACRVFMEDGNALNTKTIVGVITAIRYEESAGVLPEKVKNWLGLANKVGLNYDDGISLTFLNDTSKYNFKEIAAYIRENEKGLFVDT